MTLVAAPPLTEQQVDLLILLLEADERSLADHRLRDRFAWHTRGGMGPTQLLHRAVSADQTVDPIDLEALVTAGALERTGQRAASLSSAGIELAVRLRRDRQTATPADVSWSAVEGTLTTMWDLWLEQGAPVLGISVDEIGHRSQRDLGAVERQLQLLEQANWVTQVSPGFIGVAAPGPSYSPTPETMRRLGGWPTADQQAGAHFLEAIEAQLEATEDPDERTRLRSLLDVGKRVGEGAITQILVRLASGQFHI